MASSPTVLAHGTSRLGGVRLVISDHHLGWKTAIAKVFIAAAWQRCRVHFMRNALAKVSRANAEIRARLGWKVDAGGCRGVLIEH